MKYIRLLLKWHITIVKIVQCEKQEYKLNAEIAYGVGDPKKQI